MPYVVHPPSRKAHKIGRKIFCIFDFLCVFLRLILSKGVAQVNILGSGLNLRLFEAKFDAEFDLCCVKFGTVWGKAAGEFRS